MNPDSSIHPRPIHRSKTLWAGNLVLTFLAWAWRESTRFSINLGFGDYSLIHAGSGISFTDWKVTPRTPSWVRFPITPDNQVWFRPRLDAPETFRTAGDSIQLRNFKDANYIQGEFVPRNSAAHHFIGMLYNRILVPHSAGSKPTFTIPDARAIFLPHWLLILAFLTLWLALLLWRHRRTRHRLTKPIG